MGARQALYADLEAGAPAIAEFQLRRAALTPQQSVEFLAGVAGELTSTQGAAG